MGSEYGQDQWVVQMLGGKRNGFFIDTGAGQGVINSNTHLLETSYGWKGVCAEPVPEFFASLKATRKCPCYNVVVYDRPGWVNFALTDNKWLAGVYEDFSPEAKQRNNADQAPKLELEAWTLARLLREAKAPHLVDYWSLDTEGSEWKLIRSFPWHTFDVTLLSVEHNNEEPKRTKIKEFLMRRGYQFIQRPEAPYEDYYSKLAAPGS